MQAQRRRVFRKYKLPAFTENANVTPVYPLIQINHNLEPGAGAERMGATFGFVLHKEQIWLAQVLSIYAKSSGKNSAHSWVSDSSNITAVSYIAAQLFQPISTRHFSSTVRHTTGLKVSKFMLIKPSSFLVALTQIPAPVGQNIAISREDQVYYKALEDRVDAIKQALKEMDGRGHQGQKEGEMLD